VLRVQERKPVVGERCIVVALVAQAELRALPTPQVRFELRRERVQRLHRLRNRFLGLLRDQRQERLGEAREVPAGDRGLVAERVASMRVDGAEHRRRVVRFHEGARAVVDRLARHRHVVRVHDPVDESHVHPLRDERRLSRDDVVQQREERLGVVGERRVVASDRIQRELAQAFHVAACCVELERSHADVARRDARQHRTGQHPLAEHVFAGGRNRECARRRNAQRVHRLAHEHLAQHRAHGGLAVAAAREHRSARALERDVAAPSVAVDHFAEEKRATVAELRHEAAELVAGIGLRKRLRSRGDDVAREDRGHLRIVERGEVETKLAGERRVEEQEPRRRYGVGPACNVELRQLASERIVELERHALGGGRESVLTGHPAILSPGRSLRPRAQRRLIMRQFPRPGLAVMPLRYEDLNNEVRRISLSGRLDTVGSEEIADELASLSASANRGVVVDLSQVTFLSSMGIRALIAAAKARQANGGRMVLLVDGSDVVVRTLEATGVGELIPVYDDEGDAESAARA
jgi:anti-anti-sigma factor